VIKAAKLIIGLAAIIATAALAKLDLVEQAIVALFIVGVGLSLAD